MMDNSLISLFVRSIFVDNMIFAFFLGMCSYLAVSKTVKTALGLGIAVTFVLVVTLPVNYLLQTKVLGPNCLVEGVDLSFLSFILFIGVIAGIVQLVEMVLKKMSPSLYKALGIFLPLITTNCAILGATINAISYGYSYIESVVYAFGAGVGYMVAMVLFAGIREEKLVDLEGVPAPFKGVGIILVSASIMALSFMGFAGMFQ